MLKYNNKKRHNKNYIKSYIQNQKFIIFQYPISSHSTTKLFSTHPTLQKK